MISHSVESAPPLNYVECILIFLRNISVYGNNTVVSNSRSVAQDPTILGVDQTNLSAELIANKLSTLDVNKASGPDGIFHTIFLKKERIKSFMHAI